jgi:peptide/nickel transport system ATP-binding protein
MAEILRIENLSLGFKQNKVLNPVLHHVSLSVEAGKTLGIVGESGSGKSVTAHTILQLFPPQSIEISSGNIWFKLNGEDVDLLQFSDKHMNKLRSKSIGMVFQEPMSALNPVLTCGYQVAEAMVQHQQLSWKEAKTKTIAWFERIKLPRPTEMYDAYPHQLSGGQKQRVVIAMAICNQPSLLIADEPTTALDVTVQKSILDLLKQLQNETGMSMIFITHDLGVINQIADDVAVLYKGHLVEKGKKNDIIHNPKHPYTKGLLSCRPPVNHQPEYLLTVNDFISFENNQIVSKNYLPEVPMVSNDAIVKHRELIYNRSPLFVIDQLEKKYPIKKGFFKKTVGYVNAVNEITFNIYKNESLGLVGESGCGKTTLGRSILRLVEPSSGKLLYENNDIMRLKGEALRKKRKDLQIVFQDPFSSLNPQIKIGEAIREPMEVHGIGTSNRERKQMVEELLVKVGLSADVYDRYPHQFSGGQRQRICIARSLSVKPKFLVCDESVSALDVSVQAQILNLLNTLKKEFDLTYLFISHDLGVIKYFCDRIMVMQNGNIVEQGFSEDVFFNPQHPYTQKLIAAIPVL